jgi:cyclohexadieny/prephenate dehydrogenase
MPDISLAILGFGRIGASIALALKRYNAKGGSHHFQVAGFDSRPSVEKKATALKLADEFGGKVYNAARNRDIVVLAMPYSEMQATYELIGPDLRDGCVVIDTSPLAQPSLGWAKKHLREGAHLVSASPIVNPDYLFEAPDDIDHAHEDLFDRGAILLMPGPSCIKDAVELAADFSTLLGATPLLAPPDDLVGDEAPGCWAVSFICSPRPGLG